MGSVWKAEDSTLNRLVALKSLSSHLSENVEARERFIREAQAASALNHPNITTVHDLLESDDQHFICMEYIEGKTLRDMVESGRIGIKKAVDIIRQAAEALEAAHRKGIFHRDIKSSNIMITLEGRVKVMDFGLVHLEERSQLTRTGTTMGTLAYSSPEQLTGRPYDARSEIWSLGVVFYELVTGHLPFSSPAEGELVFAIINNEPEPLNTYRSDAPDNLVLILNRMLEKTPELRYQNCSELLQDLNLFYRELETSTVSVSNGYALMQRRPVRRLWLYGGISIGVVAAAVAIILIVSQPESDDATLLHVLPFTELTPSAEDGFSSAIQLEIGRLLRMSGIAMEAFSADEEAKMTAMAPQEIWQRYRIQYLLRGQILREQLDENRVRYRITPEIINTSNGQIESLEPISAIEGAGGLMRLLPQIAEKVNSALGRAIDLTELVQSHDENAYSLYVRSFAPNQNFSEIAALLQRAVEIDPDYALAWARFSWTLSWGTVAGAFDRKDMAQRAANNALELDPDLPEALHAMGYYYRWIESDFERALPLLQQAVEMRPEETQWHLNLLDLLGILGKWEEAREHSIAAMESNPDHEWAYRFGIEILIQMRDYETAEHYFTIMREREIGDPPTRLFESMHCLLWKSQVEESWLVLSTSQYPESFSKSRGTESNIDRTLVRIHARIFNDMIDSQIPPSVGDFHNYFLMRLSIALGMGDMSGARAWSDSIVTFHEGRAIEVENDFWYSQFVAEIGLAHAILGNKEQAIELGLQARDHYPLERDAMSAPEIMIDMAEIYTLTGESERAIALLDTLLTIPAWISTQTLQIDPIWQSLHGIPQFSDLLRKYERN